MIGHEISSIQDEVGLFLQQLHFSMNSPHHSWCADAALHVVTNCRCCRDLQVFLVFATSVVGFISVLVGRWLQLDYSAKLYVMTFVLVVMAAEHSSGGDGCVQQVAQLCNIVRF